MGQNSTTGDVNLIAVNLTNAKVELELNLPFSAEGLVGVGTSVTIDEINGIAYVVGPVSQTQWNVLSVNIMSHAIDVIYSFEKNDIPVIGVAAVFCPKQEFLWVPFGLQAGGIDMYAVDVKSKSVVRYLPSQDNAGPLSYNKKTGHINGLGISITQNGSMTNYERFLVSIDCTSGAATRGKNITDKYVIVNDDLFAINYLSQTGYAYLATFANGKLGQMRLVGVDLKLGTILVNPPPATKDQIWSLHYYTAGKSANEVETA